MVAQALELLPDLGPDVAVLRMEGLEPILVGVDVRQREGVVRDLLDAGEDVGEPAARFNPDLLQEGGAALRRAHLIWVHDLAVPNEFDAA